MQFTVTSLRRLQLVAKYASFAIKCSAFVQIPGLGVTSFASPPQGLLNKSISRNRMAQPSNGRGMREPLQRFGGYYSGDIYIAHVATVITAACSQVQVSLI